MKSASKYIFSLLCATLILSACRDEMIDSPSVAPGKETFISLSVSLPEAQVLTRADMDPIIENRVNNLWVGVYSASSGKRIYSEYRDATSHPKQFPVDVTPNHTMEPWGTVKAETGRCYIVAVANSDEQPALDVRTGNTGYMKDMIDKAETWEDFRAVAVSHLPGNVYVPRPARDVGLYMSGCYYEKENVDPESWEGLGAVNISEVGTEGDPVQLPGTIHIRRPYSQINFEIVPDYNVIELSINDYQIFNVPQYSWVYERAQQDASETNILGYANAGDAVNPDFKTNQSFPESIIFSSANMTIEQVVPADNTANAYNKYSFDFWMPENKRTGTDFCTAYTDREREFTSEIPGAPADEPNVPTKTNTGIYQSLCTSPAGDLNNNATFVKINCTIIYKDPGQGNALRTAETSYIVHLGYIKSNAKDFNIYRNSKYKYKLKISGVDNVLLEAEREGDKQPSAEGTVTDAESQGYDLDAHFNVFNVSFSDADLENYNFIMESYYNNERHIVETEKNVPSATADDWKFYDWVQLVKVDNVVRTPDELNTVALKDYPENKDNLLHLDDIKNSTKGGAGTYTLFVNENVYENSSNETGGNWKKYVNQPSRRFWIRVTEKTSNDGESIYCKSKYYAVQRSIQTYYAPDGGSSSAIGIEHINECFGMNLDWTGGYTESNLSSSNGRYNFYNRIGKGTAWTEFITPTSQQKVNAITNTNQEYYGKSEARYFTVPLTKSNTSGSSATYQANNANYYPQISGDSKQFIDAASACLNRNRDENGNDKIDVEEMKWFLPASQQMLRIILGEKNLSTPLTQYNKPTLPFYTGYGQDAIYHFATSNNRIIWTEEGLSSSFFAGSTNSGNWNKAPWEIRCVRNLGTDLSTTPSLNSDPVVQPAYTSEILETEGYYIYNSGVVKVPYYYGATLRDNSYDPLPIHKIIEDDNKLGRYGFEIAPLGNTFTRSNNTNPAETSQNFTKYSYGTTVDNTATFNAYNDYVNSPTACETLQQATGRTGWRVPNQRETAIMLNLGILTGSNFFLSCTQEYWANIVGNAYASLTPGPNFRIVGIQMSNQTGVAYTINNNVSIRCVRDLTAEEAGMTYTQIRAHKNNKPGRRSPAVSTKQSGAFRLGVLARPVR